MILSGICRSTPKTQQNKGVAHAEDQNKRIAPGIQTG